jgi:hypothetical protein
MSQIVDYGDPYMEMLSIFLRLLEKVIAESAWAADVDLSDVVLVGVKQTKANSKKQFLESPDFQAAVTEAVADSQDAHNTMADYFFTDGPAVNSIILALADAFYEAAVDQQVDSS